MLIISLLVVVVTAGLFTIAATGDIHGIRDFYKVHYQLNPLTEEEESIFLELKYLAKNEPDQLQDKELLKDYDFKLRTVRAGLFVRRESNNDGVTPLQHAISRGYKEMAEVLTAAGGK